MADVLVTWLQQSLPEELAAVTEPYIVKLEHGEYQALLASDEAKQFFGHIEIPGSVDVKLDGDSTWSDHISTRLSLLRTDDGRLRPETAVRLLCVGYAALLAFLQSNVTGPPLAFSSAELLFPSNVSEDARWTKQYRKTLIAGLRIDGIAAYKLTPNVELLCLADSVLSEPAVVDTVGGPARWAKVRVAVMKQRLLAEVSSSLQGAIYDDLDVLEEGVFSSLGKSGISEAIRVEFLLERAAIHIQHGLDKLARADIEKARELRRFEYALTGRLGKRTKFQQKDTSQLVVLAKSAARDDAAVDGNGHKPEETADGSGSARATAERQAATAPAALDLNDDTLLESISFTNQPPAEANGKQEDSSLPPTLEGLDPSNQPQLDALDSVILLAFASSITNTSPQYGLTREETLPYATRVLEGGSSNWQVYTQALLLRSRIEGYHSRTIERGLLQLQALVDQVIADTAGSSVAVPASLPEGSAAASFLPRAADTESAPATERLRYVFQLAPPTRWNLEAELAARWVQLGGLRSALEIYERLELWAEAALCWAATEREDKAKKMVRNQLFHATNGGPHVPEYDVDEDEETWEGPERSPPSLDAPRLYCILGDLDSSIEMYEKAWEVSQQRYARAQRSLGRLYIANRDFLKAADAYAKSLRVNQLNGSSWFALGCALLELTQYENAAEAFSRCVQLDDTDAEAWSNFAAALLRIEPTNSDRDEDPVPPAADEEADVEIVNKPKADSQANRQDALKALKRAATLKHDSYRIWENVLIVSASLSPPDYISALSAQKRIIDLRGRRDGEKCIDKQVLELLAQHVISMNDSYDASKPGLARIFVKFIDDSVVPLITGSADLWRLVSRLALWRNKPSSALDTEEKAWRVVTSQPSGWETESESAWNEVVEATVRLCDSYESLGPRERTEGMGAGELVAKDWKFKARTAVRGILGKGKATWEGSEGWERLQEYLQGLKG